MNVKLRVLSAGVLFLCWAYLYGTKVKKDTASIQDIDEVVVIGYSKVNRSNFVGTASKVEMSSVDNKSVSTVSQALAGEVAGVRVINPSGQPGQEGVIRIRGFGSVNGSRDPLYVVDGAPYSGNISAINPDDIESMVILKDAYRLLPPIKKYGARGANGVIVLNTKKGKGRSYVQVESKVGINTSLLPRYSVIKSPEDYIGLSWEALYNQGYFNGNADPVAYANSRLFSASGISPYYNMWNATAAQLIDPVTKKVRPGMERRYTPENWEREAFSPGFRTENNFSIGGGDNKTKYYTNLGYLKDEGYSINSQYERYTGRLNVSHQAKSWLKGEFNLGYAYSKTKNGGQSSDSGSIFWFVDNIPSIYPLYLRDAKGNLVPDPYYGGNIFDYGANGRGFGALTNSIADAKISKMGNIKHEINANFFLEAKFTDFLKFETRLSDANNNGKFDVGEQISSLYEYMQSNPNAKISEGTTEVYSQATQRFVGKSVMPDISGAANLKPLLRKQVANPLPQYKLNDFIDDVNAVREALQGMMIFVRRILIFFRHVVFGCIGGYYTNNVNYTPWRYYYRLINGVNDVIDGLGGNDASPTGDNAYGMGQAKTLRAYAYYYLLQLYTNKYDPGADALPLYTTSGSPATGKSKQSEIYAQIIKDLTDAVNLLNGYNRPNKGVINKYVAEGYLAYAYAAIGDNINAAKYSKDIIRFNEFSITTKVQQPGDSKFWRHRVGCGDLILL
ncbi:hypothetical protein FQR65_LT16215 [Abscondita terminalis]|nr:hypothetical protein FQR65_LT16215 [Abscondita terminalis]